MKMFFAVGRKRIRLGTCLLQCSDSTFSSTYRRPFATMLSMYD
ncbi:unnamed protein product, partial [Dibothriocephalus latus]